MKYQLVLQWPASSIADYDEMIWLEEALISGIGSVALVDGHDAGANEVNIFLFTDDPNKAFLEIKRILGSKDFMVGLKAAFRQRKESNYTIIWPPGATSFAVK